MNAPAMSNKSSNTSVGVPKEVKVHEHRVGLTPASVAEIVTRGHRVFVETGAGSGIDIQDDEYIAAGAHILPAARDVFEAANLIVKVKEPQLHECAMLQPHHTLFTYLHLAADEAQARALVSSGATCIAYETVTDSKGGLPLLRPMSEVAGRMSIQVGAHHLEKEQGGRGILLGGVPGVAPAKVVILGGGVSGLNAAQIALGMRADVTIYDISAPRLAEIDAMFGGSVKTTFASRSAICDGIRDASLVIGAVLVPGAAAAKLITGDMLKSMARGTVLVDIAIDQGGCFETSRATTHDQPVFEVEGVLHYCVANMPGAVPRTSTFALNNVTLPFVLKLADLGAATALETDPHLANGVNVHAGRLVHQAVSAALGQLPRAA